MCCRALLGRVAGRLGWGPPPTHLSHNRFTCPLRPRVRDAGAQRGPPRLQVGHQGAVLDVRRGQRGLWARSRGACSCAAACTACPPASPPCSPRRVSAPAPTRPPPPGTASCPASAPAALASSSRSAVRGQLQSPAARCCGSMRRQLATQPLIRSRVTCRRIAVHELWGVLLVPRARAPAAVSVGQLGAAAAHAAAAAARPAAAPHNQLARCPAPHPSTGGTACRPRAACLPASTTAWSTSSACGSAGAGVAGRCSRARASSIGGGGGGGAAAAEPGAHLSVSFAHC